MLVYVDESGDHNLDLAKSDNNYNVFVIGAILIDKVAAPGIDAEFKDFKRMFFGGEDFIVHTDELTRPTGRKSDPRNALMRNAEKRVEFYKWMNNFIERIPIRVFFSIILKGPFVQQYRYPMDPYEMGFENILNRTLYFGTSNDIEIYPECRDSNLDKKLLAEFTKYSIGGTRFHSAEKIKERIKKFECKKKNENLTGLQLADLLVNPVGRHFLGIKPRIAGNEIDYEVIRKKLAGNEKMSLKVFP